MDWNDLIPCLIMSLTMAHSSLIILYARHSRVLFEGNCDVHRVLMDADGHHRVDPSDR
jgi:hypothetical protein